MPFTKFTNLDYDQIKTSIKDYLRANSNFTDFDFDGSNFSVLIDTLAYNTYITAFNSNMVVNESFLDSATLRENVVSLASNIGYTPRSRSAALAQISFDITNLGNDISSVTLKPGIVCTGDINNESYTFSITESITTNVSNNKASFKNINVYQGTFLSKQFTYDGSLDQRFILNNPYIDSSKIVVYIKNTGENGFGLKYNLINDLIDVNLNSRIYFIREIQDEKYEIKFGDGIFGKKLGTESSDDGNVITVHYMVTDGEDGNGAGGKVGSTDIFRFAGSLQNQNQADITTFLAGSITTNAPSQNGANIESLDSVKYYSPLTYSAQNRAVTPRDYEALIKRIYPNTDSVSVIGGEELDPPEFGTVSISIKPKNGSYVSDFSKSRILSQIKQYSVSGISQKIVDLKILYVEVDSSVYYNDSFVSTPDTLKTNVIKSLTDYSKSVNLNKFGGRFKYSKVLQVIDDTDTSITSNITKVKIRRDLQASLNQWAQYELCFGNKFHVDSKGYNIKSTGFTVDGESSTVYLTDIPDEDRKKGTLSIVKITDDILTVVTSSAGIVDYEKGEILLSTINVTSTAEPNNIIEIQAFPESNDVVGLKDLYLSFAVSESKINMMRDVISSGDEISGVQFTRDFYTSSYSNGSITRE
tara:strand:- start:27374 stop:29302 length:1929 start_codon:yes stop_codon:yes gene_type:complete